jgi:hypothetical protein
MSNLGLRKSVNKILVAGNPLVLKQKVETATSMYPGRLVIKGTNDDDITVCGAGGIATGWLGYEQEGNAAYMPDDVNSIYTVNAKAPVLCGGNFIVVAYLAQSQTIVKGDRLVAAASGMVSKAAAAVCTTGAATASAVVSTQPTITGSVGIGGIVIGIAMETVTTTSSEADIMVLSLI